MRIYKSKHAGFWFAQTKENGWFCFSDTIPDLDSLQICPGSFGYEEENEAWDNSIEIPKSDEDKFNKFVKSKGNYKKVCEFVRTYYPETSQEELDKEFKHYPEVLQLTIDCFEVSGTKKSYDFDYFIARLFEKVLSHMRRWDNNRERVMKYVITHDIPELISFHTTMIDVFGVKHPTESFLYHEFYNSWSNKQLDSWIKEAVEKYPDEKDFDLAYYYVKERLTGERNGERKTDREENTAST